MSLLPAAEERQDDYPFTDEELAAMALAADPDQPVPADAVPLTLDAGCPGPYLPAWYMPPAMARVSSRWRSALVIGIVLALVLIDAFGLCSTYGIVTPA
jgi:hypothetical protein